MTAVVADHAPDPTAGRLVPRVRIKPDRWLPILVAFSLLAHALVLLPLLLRDDPVAKPRAQEIPVELVREPPKPPEKKAEAPGAQSAAKPEAKSETKPPEQKKPEQKPPEQKSPEQKAPEEKAPEQKPPQKKPQDQKRPEQQPEQKKPEPKPKEQKAPEQKPQEQKKQPAPEPQRKAEQRQAPQKSAESQAERMHDLLGDPPPGMAAIALPGTSADGSIEVSYGQLVLSNVAKAKKQGRYQGTPGKTLVSFTLGDAGEITRVAVREPSGIPDLDEEAVAMIKRGAPYPPPPPGAPRDFTIGLAFKAE